MFKKRITIFRKKIISNYIYIYYVLIITLTICNLNNYLQISSPLVLGIGTNNPYGIFWYGFLQQNPDYIPGWVETGRLDKVKEIDPNYF